MPMGTVVSSDAFPYIVMRDRVGFFVYEFGAPFRHYCRNKSDALKHAKLMKATT